MTNETDRDKLRSARRRERKLRKFIKDLLAHLEWIEWGGPGEMEKERRLVRRADEFQRTGELR